MTEICDRTLRRQGPALLFENPTGFDMPVLGNLFGTPGRVALGMGAEDVSELREIGKLLAFLKRAGAAEGAEGRPEQAADLQEGHQHGAQGLKDAPCQEVIVEGDDVDLTKIPVQHCWPGDAAPLITGPDHHQGAEQGTAEPRHLPSAGDRP